MLIGVLPGFGGIVLLYVFFKTVWDSRTEDYGYGLLFGVGTVLVIGTLLLVVGVPLMLLVLVQVPEVLHLSTRPGRPREGPQLGRHARSAARHVHRDDRRGREPDMAVQLVVGVGGDGGG